MARSTWKVTVVEAVASPPDEGLRPMEVTRPENMIPAARTSCGKMTVPGETGEGPGSLGGGIHTGATGEVKRSGSGLVVSAGARLGARSAAARPRRNVGATKIEATKISEKTVSRRRRLLPDINHHLGTKCLLGGIWETDSILSGGRG